MFPRCVCKSLYSNKYSHSPYVYSPYVPKKFFQFLSSPEIFPSPYAPQSLCFPVPVFTKHQCSPILNKGLCSPKLFPSHYVPPTCSPVCMVPNIFLMFTISINPRVFFNPYVPRGCYIDPKLHSPMFPSLSQSCFWNRGTGEHKDCATKGLGSIGTGKD